MKNTVKPETPCDAGDQVWTWVAIGNDARTKVLGPIGIANVNGNVVLRTGKTASSWRTLAPM